MKQLLYYLARLYRQIFRPKTLWVRLLLINDDKVLLVKHSYQDSYYLPWGGVKNNEYFDIALKRELDEELQIKIECFSLFGVYQSMMEWKRDTIVIFHSTQKISLDEIVFQNGEIEDVIMADINNLPEKTSPGTRRRIDEYKCGKFSGTGRW